MDSTNVLKYQFRILRTLGIYTTSDSNRLLKLWGIIVFIWSGLILVCCQFISVIYAESSNGMIEEILFLLTTSSIPVKVFCFYIRIDNLSNILDILKMVDNQVENEDDILTMQKLYRRCRRITTTFYSFYLSTVMSLFVQLIFLEKEERTWKSTILVPFEFAQRSSVYHTVLFFQSIGNLLNCLLAVSTDTYCYTLLNLLNGHINILSTNISKIGDSNQEKRNSASKSGYLLKNLEQYNLLSMYVTVNL